MVIAQLQLLPLLTTTGFKTACLSCSQDTFKLKVISLAQDMQYLFY